MIVNPETGEPISISQPSTLGSAVAGDIAQGYGITPENHSTLFSMLSHVPSAYQTMGANALRGSNTILRGGFANKSLGAFGNHNLMRPRTWRRFSSADNITGNGKAYTPFNSLTSAGNYITKKSVEKNFLGVADKFNEMGITAGEEGKYFSGGMLSRLTAAQRLARGDVESFTAKKVAGLSGRRARKFAARRSNTMDFITQADPALAKAMGAAEFSNAQMGAFASVAGTNPASQYVGGYAARLMGGVDESVNTALKSAGKEAAIRGAARAATHLEGVGLEATAKGFLVKATGREVGYMGAARVALQGEGGAAIARGLGAVGAKRLLSVVPGLNAIGWAWTAYDLTRMAMASMSKLPGFAKDALVSFRGSLNKPIMGMGYRDSTVAATSRARGVMAIQNSQLNARSVLGSEGAAMFAHFG